MPSIALTPVSVPSDEPIPTSAQGIVNLTAGYLSVSGLETVQGVIISAAEPAPEQRSQLWVKLDASTLRTLGLATYRGAWNPMPMVAPAAPAAQAPAGPQTGEFFFNTDATSLQFYNGAAWTTNLWPMGTTADRPASPNLRDLYYDTDISRLLIYQSSGWSTVDGAIGDIKPVTNTTVADALTKNPGWSEYTGLQGTFPMGYDNDHAAGTTGGRLTFPWSCQQGSDRSGDEQTALWQLTLDGTSTPQYSSNKPVASATTNGTVDITPPYLALVWLKKDF